MRRLFLSLAFTSTLAAAAPPQQVEAQYIVTTNGGITIGRANETFTRKGDTYAIRSETRSEGVLKAFVDDQFTVESSGRVAKEGLKPLEYTERRAKDSKRDLKSTFDYRIDVMHTVMRDEPSDAWVPPGTQDRMSIMYQFGHMGELGETLVIPMADRRRIKTYKWKLAGEERITTPAGEFDTRHYQRVIEQVIPGEKETKVDVWLAKARSNFPVRVIFDDPKGFKLEQLLVALEMR
jgi:hypothetical protein